MRKILSLFNINRIKVGSSGFTLIELLIVIGVLGLVAGGFISNRTTIGIANSVRADFNSMSVYLKRIRLDAYSQKINIAVTVNANSITSIYDPGGANTNGPWLNLDNPMVVTGSPFTVSTRGAFSAGNIRLNNPPRNVKYTCVAISPLRVRLGEINGVVCDAM